jgi:hypothetical protein
VGKLKSPLFLFAFLFTYSISSETAKASSGVALIIEASNIDLKPYSEIAADSTINLGAEGTLKFIHYQSCREVTAIGGQVSITSLDYEGPGIVSEVSQVCPHRVGNPSNTAVSAGIVMRGTSSIPKVGPQSTIVIIGSSAASFSDARFVAEDKSTFDSVIKKQIVALPSGLRSEMKYKIQLIKDGNTQIDFQFEIGNVFPNKFILLQVD